MIDDEHFDRVLEALPFLASAEPTLLEEIRRVAFFRRIPTGRDIFGEGDQADVIAFLLSGVVRVYKIGETGREITLYRFGLGESCILTANAILSQQTFPAIASVEEEADAVLIPADAFRDWVRRYEPWREFVFDLFSQRMAAVMEIVDQVAFQRMDRRVSQFLAERARGENPVRITHREIAAEVGSSREVISRLIEDFASKGWVQPGRGEIQVLNIESLEALARS